ncbi:MAG: DUF4105 domain-containing protein [Arenimonas sp.]
MAMLRGLLFFVFALFSHAVFSQTVPDNIVLRAGVITMAPGEEFWARFGHDAIVIEDTGTGESMSFNFGFFNMDEPGFFGNFINGHMQYQLVALPTEEDLQHYREMGRGVGVQWLNLDQKQIRDLYSALAVNARPENSRYTYDYFKANCSTRVRDSLDTVLNGQIKMQLSSPSLGNSYRSESVRLAWPAKWMAMGFHLGLGPAADAPLSRWDEAFIPMRLRDSLREIKLVSGKPLVTSEEELVPHRLSMPPIDMPPWKKTAFMIGIFLAIGIFFFAKRMPRLLASMAGIFWLFAGLLGCLMLFVWFGSAHWAGYRNANLLLLSPLALALLPGAWRLLRKKQPGKYFNYLLWLMAASAAAAGFLQMLPFLAQQNFEWVLMLLPVHLALAKSFGSKPDNLQD